MELVIENEVNVCVSLVVTIEGKSHVLAQRDAPVEARLEQIE